MAVVRYTAKRSLLSGVTIGDTVVLNLPLAIKGGLTRSRHAQRTDHTSIGGVSESIYIRAEKTWDCMTVPRRTTDATALLQFLDSVEDGTAFEFSAYQVAVDTPTYTDVMLTSMGYTEQRAVPLGGSGKGANDYFVYSFQIRELP